jgi:hypothetical protein
MEALRLQAIEGYRKQRGTAQQVGAATNASLKALLG